MPSSKPSIAELRTVCQPRSVVGRRNAEHWAGRLYMRRVSVHVTRALLEAPVTPNGLTVLMMAVGVLASLVAVWPGLVTALVAAVLIQLYLLLDCVDGEVARWRRVTSTSGVFLDRLGHHVVEAALLIGLGLRAQGGGLLTFGGWSTLGACAAVCVLVNKVSSDLVVVARVGGGLPVDVERDPEPGRASLRSIRTHVGRLGLHRMVGAIELSLLLVLAAVVDLVTGSAVGSRGLAAFSAVTALGIAVAHPVMILSSERLR